MGILARARRQLRFIKMFLTEQLKHYGLTNAVEIYRFWTSVDSDISTKDMAKLVYAFGGTNVSDFFFLYPAGESRRQYVVTRPWIMRIIGCMIL